MFTFMKQTCSYTLYEIAEKKFFLLTLWLAQRPEAPVKYGTQLKNQIFLKQENHVSISVLKQSLIVSLRL